MMKMRSKIFLLLIFFAGQIQAQKPDLNYFVEQAEQNSPLIQKNKDAKNLLELDMKQTEALLKSPVINLESNLLFAPIISNDNNTSRFDLTSAGATNYTGYDLGITNGGQFQTFVSINQPLFTGSSLKVYASKKDVGTKISENASVMTKHEIQQLVGYQYILCLKSKLQTENFHLNLKQVEEQLQTLQKLVEHAIYKQTDLILLQIEYQNIVLENNALQNDFRNNLYDLKLLCGINDEKITDIEPQELKMKLETTESSSFLKSYKLDSLNIVADQAVSELKYKPQLNLFANAGLNAVYIPTFNRLGFSAGVTFIWNIYDGGQRQIEANKSKVNLHSLLFEQTNFKTQMEINRNKIKHQLNSLNEQTRLIDNQLNQYDQLYKAYQKELSHGQISIMDFKNLLKDITAKKQEKTLLKMEEQVLINSYNYWNY